MTTFPREPNDEFYKQFDDPARAYSNMPSAYAYALENPTTAECELDYINYVRKLATETAFFATRYTN